MLEYFTLKSIQKLNFRAKNLDFDIKSKKLGLTNQIHIFSWNWIFGQKWWCTRFESDFLPYALLQFRSLSNYELRNSKWTLNVQRTGKVPEIFQVPEWDLLVIFVLDIHRKKPKPWKMLGLEFHIRQLWKSRLARHLGTGELHLGKIRLVTNWTILDP